jgi:predicted acylesterase/phospholipase RssA
MEIDTLCLGSGGIFGISFLSAINFLIENNYFSLSNIKNYYGTSVGSILGFLFIIGYTSSEIIEIILTTKLSDYDLDINLDNLIDNFGLDNGDKIISLIKDLCEKKLNLKEITFQELYELTNKNFIINTTNFTTTSELIMSRENTPNLSVLIAIRMSISVPLIFTPVLYKDNYYIDGAISNSLLINLCNQETTLGFYIASSQNNELKSVQDLIIGSLLMLSNKIKYDYNKYKILDIILDNDISLIDLNKETIEKLLDIGSKSAKVFYLNELKNKITKTKNNIDNKINKIVKDIINNIIEKIEHDNNLFVINR